MSEVYPFEAILLNHRQVSIKDILSGKVQGDTDFEKEAIVFLKDWLSGKEKFNIKTSGSTGTPKIIEVDRWQMIESARATINALKLTPGETALVCLHTRYIAGKMMFVRALINGLRIIAVEPSSNPIAGIDTSLHIDFTAMVPMQLKAIMNTNFIHRLDSIKNIIVGGAAISESLRECIITKLTTKVYATYGMTETITHIALQEICDEYQANIFTPLPGVKTSTDNRGCLVIEAGYLKGPVVTNDLVEMTGEGKFRWLGRFDNIINTGGLKVIPEQIEKIIDTLFKEHGIRQRFCVGSQPDDLLGQKVILFIEGPKLPDTVTHTLHIKLKELLSTHEVPKEIRYISAFVETETGKVNLKATLASYN